MELDKINKSRISHILSEYNNKYDNILSQDT